MKEALFSLALILLVARLGFAQGTDQVFKATSGITTDVNFTPFKSNGPAVGIESINVRWFIKPQFAIRMGLQADYQADKLDNGNSVVVINSSTFLFGILPGIEYHFKGTNHLSPYLGAEVYFYNFSSQAHAAWQEQNFYTISGATDNLESGFKDRAFNEFGLSVGAGFDYYFSRNIYTGAEIGYGFSYFRYGTVIETKNGVITVNTNYGRLSAMKLGNSRGTLKLGWKF